MPIFIYSLFISDFAGLRGLFVVTKVNCIRVTSSVRGNSPADRTKQYNIPDGQKDVNSPIFSEKQQFGH